jgi:hypothetical protein
VVERMGRPHIGHCCRVHCAPEVISVLDYTQGFGHTDLVSC